MTEICEKCGQEVKNKIIRRSTRDIWRSINILLGLDFDNYDEHIMRTYTQKELIKLENALKKIVENKK
jgi:hypothetical protein